MSARRRGMLVAPGVSPGITSPFFVEARFSGRQSLDTDPLVTANGLCRPSGARGSFPSFTPGLRPGLLVCRHLRWLIDACFLRVYHFSFLLIRSFAMNN